jgi:hypothetical protein
MRKISAEEVRRLPEGTKVYVGKDGIRDRLEYELKGGPRARLLRLPHKESYLPIHERKGWAYYVEEKEV